MKYSDWTIQFKNAEKEITSEQKKILTLRNVYLTWRGYPIWQEASGPIQPNLTVMGLSDDFPFPNPQLFRFYVNQQLLSFDQENIIDQTRQLNLETGSQSDKYTVRLPEGFINLQVTRYVDPINPHVIGLEGDLSASFSGELKLESLITGETIANVSDHVWSAKQKSDQELAIAAKSFVDGQLMEQVSGTDLQLLETKDLHFETNSPIHFEKIMVLADNQQLEQPQDFVRKTVESLPLASIKEHSNQYWQDVWRQTDFEVRYIEQFSLPERGSHPFLPTFLHLSIFKLQQRIQLSNDESSQYLPNFKGNSWEKSFISSYYVWNTPEIAGRFLKAQIAKSENNLAVFSILYQLRVYEKLTDNPQLLTEGGLELLLKTIKDCLNKITIDSNGDYHLRYSEGVGESLYVNLMFLWLIDWLFSLAADKKVKKISAAKRVGFTDQIYENAEKVSHRLYLPTGSSAFNDFLMADNILGSKKVQSLLKQVKQPYPVGYTVNQIPESKILKIALAGFYISLNQAQKAEAILSEVINSETDFMDGEQSLSLMSMIIDLCRNKFLGIQLTEQGLCFEPKQLPNSWSRLIFRQSYQGAQIEVEISQRLLILKSNQDVQLTVYGSPVELKADVLSSFAIRR